MQYKTVKNGYRTKSGMTEHQCHSYVGRNLSGSRIKLGMMGFLLASLIGVANATNIAEVAKTSPGDTATAGAGKQWPTTRFVVSGGCVTDKLTGLMWSKNGNLLGKGTWGDSTTAGTAQYMVAQMNTNSIATGYQLCGYSDWRLPKQKELLSLFNYAASSNNQANWLNGAGFTTVQASFYWSSTQGGSGAWYVRMDNSSSSSGGVTTGRYVWPVRGGQ